MKKYFLLWLLIMTCIIFSRGKGLASEEDTARNFSYLNHNLSVSIKNSPLEYVLEQVAKKTGVEFVFDKKMSEDEIKVEFMSLPVEKAIRRILNRFNYAIIYASNGAILKVVITGNRNKLLMNNVQIISQKNTGSSGGMAIANLPDKVSSNALPEGMNISN
jgi:type II secretory pathway component GspD/PulD (secretin)